MMPRRMSPLVARFRHAERIGRCPFPGETGSSRPTAKATRLTQHQRIGCWVLRLGAFAQKDEIPALSSEML